jgi:hypothetical protein
MIRRALNFRTLLMLLVISTSGFAGQTSQHTESDHEQSLFKLHVNGIGIHFDKGENTNEQNWGLGIQGSLARYQNSAQFLEGWDLFWEADAYQDSYSDVALSVGAGMQKSLLPYLDFGLKAGLVYEEGLKEDAGSNVLPFLLPFVETNFQSMPNLRATLVPPIGALNIGGVLSLQLIVDLK